MAFAWQPVLRAQTEELLLPLRNSSDTQLSSLPSGLGPPVLPINTPFSATRKSHGTMLALFIALLFATTAFAVPTIEAKGARFFTSDGDQWFIKGIAYQLTPDDPLAQGDQCKLDAALMKTLGANAIRVYHVDPAANHDECMSAFEDAGIYLFLDLDTFSTYILPDDPHWNETQFNVSGRRPASSSHTNQ